MILEVSTGMIRQQKYNLFFCFVYPGYLSAKKNTQDEEIDNHKLL